MAALSVQDVASHFKFSPAGFALTTWHEHVYGPGRGYIIARPRQSERKSRASTCLELDRRRAWRSLGYRRSANRSPLAERRTDNKINRPSRISKKNRIRSKFYEKQSVFEKSEL